MTDTEEGTHLNLWPPHVRRRGRSGEEERGREGEGRGRKEKITPVELNAETHQVAKEPKISKSGVQSPEQDGCATPTKAQGTSQRERENRRARSWKDAQQKDVFWTSHSIALANSPLLWLSA